MPETLPHGDPDRLILTTALLALVFAFAAGLLVPPFFSLALGLSVAAGAVFLGYRHTTGFSVAWLLVTGASLEMTLHDLVGNEMYQATIAAVKGVEIALGLICALRFGFRMDLFSPVWAYLAMLVAGLVHGLAPGLTVADSLRSLVGSVAPFVFCFCRLPRSWGEAMIGATKWCPLLVVLAGIPFDVTGIRPLFVDSGGLRLAGLGHPAFLAGVCLPAVYACLIHLYRHGRHGDLWLLLANFMILLATGARAPLAYAAAVSGLSVLSIRSTTFSPHARLLTVLAAGALLPVLGLLTGDLGEIRLFNVLANHAANLSGRTLLWPEFEAAAAQSPWFGWGIGAGNVVIPPDGRIVQQLHTWAAHNEYLRMQVEGGEIGRGLLIILFIAWVVAHTRELPTSDRRIMQLAFLAFACHAMTDNVLISTPACVLFAFATAVFLQAGEKPARLVLPDRVGLA